MGDWGRARVRALVQVGVGGEDVVLVELEAGGGGGGRRGGEEAEEAIGARGFLRAERVHGVPKRACSFRLVSPESRCFG